MSDDAREKQQRLLAATIDRLRRIPASANYQVALDDVRAIGARLETGPPIDKPFFDHLRIGVICARELEASDPDYCQLVYALLDAIDPAPDEFE